MDQYLSTVIIAFITGVFSLITLIIQKKQDKVISKIDNQNIILEKEKKLKQQLLNKEKEQKKIINRIIMITLDTNLYILSITKDNGSIIPDEKVFDNAENLKAEYIQLSKEIDSINKEYEMVLNLNEELNK